MGVVVEKCTCRIGLRTIECKNGLSLRAVEVGWRTYCKGGLASVEVAGAVLQKWAGVCRSG